MTKDLINNERTKTINLLREQIGMRCDNIKMLRSEDVELEKLALSEYDLWKTSSIVDGFFHRNLSNDDNDETSFIIAKVEKGIFVREHSYDRTEKMLCLKGKVELYFTETKKTRVLTPIDSVTIIANTKYETNYLEDSEIFVAWKPKINKNKD